MSERLHLIDTLLQDLENVDGELSIRRVRGAWRVRLTPDQHMAYRPVSGESGTLADALRDVIYESEEQSVDG